MYVHVLLWFKCTHMLQVSELTSIKHPQERLNALQAWQKYGGVMLMGYEMYRILSQGHKINDEEWKKKFKRALVDPGSVTL